MRWHLANLIRSWGNAILRFGDWVDPSELVATIPIDLEPEHALKALRDAEAQRRGELVALPDVEPLRDPRDH